MGPGRPWGGQAMSSQVATPSFAAAVMLSPPPKQTSAVNRTEAMKRSEGELMPAAAIAAAMASAMALLKLRLVIAGLVIAAAR